jgi:hypothetical protein
MGISTQRDYVLAEVVVCTKYSFLRLVNLRESEGVAVTVVSG